MKKILCTVTNDLTYDQRMQRICTTLAQAGYAVTLVGRALPDSAPLTEQPFAQRRLQCRFRKGMFFYAEYNLRLFFYLLRAPFDALCSVDLDTLAAGCAATLLRGKKRVFDAHEYFTETPEVTARPLVKAAWSAVARLCLPFYRHAYTVGPALAEIFEKRYGVKFAVVRNVPARASTPEGPGVTRGPGFLLYQGALNQSRGIEQVLDAMPLLPDCELWLAGEGDLSEALRRRAADLGVLGNTHFLGRVKPGDLKAVTARAWLGLNVLENNGLSYYFSLANKFFDYVHAGVPVLTMNFPEYRLLNEEHEVALLLDHLTSEAVVAAVRQLQNEPERYRRLRDNCAAAREAWHWGRDSETLLQVWSNVFETPKQSNQSV